VKVGGICNGACGGVHGGKSAGWPGLGVEVLGGKKGPAGEIGRLPVVWGGICVGAIAGRTRPRSGGLE
jgi:hypothetical protein